VELTLRSGVNLRAAFTPVDPKRPNR